MLNKFISNYFEYFPQTDCILNNYNQFLQNMSSIIQCFNFEYTYKNNFDQIITIVYQLDDVSYEINQITTEDIINAQQCRDRETDLMQKFLFDMTFKIKYYPKDGSEVQIKTIKSKNRFKFEIPILSLTYNDVVRQMSDLERWRNGIDINLVGGDLILAGVKYILPNLWSFPFNKPIVVTADKNQQVVRAEYLRQTNPIFGNSYYIAYHIVVDKNSNPDIVVYLKQNHDQRFNKDNKKTTPVYIPILLLFYVYGIENDEQFLKICNKNNNVSYGLFLLNALRYGQYHTRLQQMYPDFRSKDKAKQYLAQYILLPDYCDHITDILEKYVHPIDNKFFIVLQDVIYKMYKVYKDPSAQFDKDSLQNKRVKTVAEQVVEQLRSRMAENYKQEMHNLEQDKFKITPFEEMHTLQSTLENSAQNYSTKITKTMKRSFTSPNSSIQSSCLRKVQNEYKFVNYDLIQKREIVIRAEGKGKITWHQRKVQNSFFGFIDPVQTPEAGDNVGRYLSPTIYAQITCGQDPKIVQEYLDKNELFIKDTPIQDIIDGRLKNKFPVKINYITYGFVEADNLFKLYYQILDWKCSSLDRIFISIYYSIEHQELIILTDIGRIMIPLLHNVETFEELNNTPIKELVQQKKIIFVCSEMIQNFLVKPSVDISFSKQNGHNKKIYDKNAYYFLPYETLSPITATNPFINHMKSVRASYSCPQQKQGIGCPNTNYMNNMPNDQLILHKLQRSPIKTAIGETVYKHIPLGNLVNIAIMEYCYNQEDAIVACQGYFNRGGLQVSEYHTNQIVLSSNKNIFAINKDIYEKNKETYHLINQNMFIPDHIGESIQQGDVLIASIITSQQLPIPRIHNNTFQNDINAKYILISNFNSLFTNLQKTYKMTRIQIARQTNIGDKFISRNAQKGTIGKILQEWELPIDENGISPNFITSSQSILKRETYGQLLEIVLNRKLCYERKYRIQLGVDERHLENDLISSLSKIEPQTLISDQGIPIKNKITTGPITYIPYTHLVENKIRARNDGAIDQITKQPVSGKKHDGGLKMGTLDVSSLFTQGICNTMRHQFGQNSSNCQWFYCKNCHYVSVYKQRITGQYVCQYCKQQIPQKQIGYGSYNYGLKFYNDVMYSLGFQLQIFDDGPLQESMDVEKQQQAFVLKHPHKKQPKALTNSSHLDNTDVEDENDVNGEDVDEVSSQNNADNEETELCEEYSSNSENVVEETKDDLEDQDDQDDRELQDDQDEQDDQDDQQESSSI